MTIVVKSAEPLTREEKTNVKRIMQESRCPHETLAAETLAASFPRYHATESGKILFDEGERGIETKILY